MLIFVQLNVLAKTVAFFYDLLFASNYENSLKKKKRQKAAKEAILAKEWPA